MVVHPGRMRMQAGATMIEVLVTLAVVVIGLWALLDLNIRLQVSEGEVYQRTRAMLLLDDMAERMSINRPAASDYVTDAATGLGAGVCADPLTASALVTRDRAQWCQALQSANQGQAARRTGTLIGGRGCIELLEDVPGEEYLLTVAWQGSMPLSPPPEGITCGKDQYDQPPGSACAGHADSCRRYVSTRLHLADLIQP